MWGPSGSETILLPQDFAERGNSMHKEHIRTPCARSETRKHHSGTNVVLTQGKITIIIHMAVPFEL